MASFIFYDIFYAAVQNNARAPEACRELAFFRPNCGRLLISPSVSGAGSLYVVSSMMFRSDEFACKSSIGIKVWQILLTTCLIRLWSVRRRSVAAFFSSVRL